MTDPKQPNEWSKPSGNPTQRYGLSAQRVLFDYNAHKFNRLPEEWGSPEPWKNHKGQ